MPEERWRCFVAVPIGEELRASLTSYVEQLRRAPLADAWRWTDPASWHITLAFLGDIAPSSVPVVADALREVAARHTVFTVPTGGLGVFPSSQRPRVLWYGVDDPSGQLAALATDVRAAHHVVDSPFHGHITLARGGEHRDRRLPTPQDLPPPSALARVRFPSLYRSEGGRVSTYQALASAALLGSQPERHQWTNPR
jgi:2'-5' RNA ligase